jgi:putative hemolysin
MKILATALLISLSLLVHSSESKDYWVKIGEEKFPLKIHQKGYLSTKCKSCSALKAAKSKTIISENEFLDKNPGSVACTKQGGKVNIGKLHSGHSQAFCFFKDKSFISVNLLKY